MRTVEILDNPEAISLSVLESIVAAAADAIAVRGRFMIALAGGSTPEKTYRLLALPENAQRVDWTRTFVFTGDERDVPTDDPRSNWGNACRQLLDLVPLPAENRYPSVATPGDPAGAAIRYEQTLRSVFASDTVPRFDMILLGMGDDGHTASLFPNYPSLDVRDRLFVASPAGTLPPPVDRITSTFLLINAARHVFFMVAGENKAEAVRDVLERDASVATRPAAGVVPTSGSVTWLLDKDAAALLRGGLNPNE